jgi:hypothetical protein
LPDDRDALARVMGGSQAAPPQFPPMPTVPFKVPAQQPDLATRTRMPPMTPESSGTQLQIPPQFQPQYHQPPGPTWQPTPTMPFGGLDINTWKDPNQPPQQVGVAGTGPTAEELQILRSLVNGIRAQGGGL